ncbi:MAG TPA: response regulator [Clostridia bacterium]|nr:response regulator [Clostridia bacterium]
MTNCRVMVVDENAGFRDVIVSLIAERGFEAYPAADGIDALRQIYDVMPSVIVADAILPDISGFRFLPFVRRRFPAIGVIAMRGESTSVFQPTEVVADEVFPKEPANFDRLLQSVEELARGAAQELEARRSHVRLIEIAEGEVTRIGSGQCTLCEVLLRSVKKALLNSVLAVSWERSRNQDTETAAEVGAAERTLDRALNDLNAHKTEMHFEKAD